MRGSNVIDLSRWLESYRTLLFDDVIPFWLRHAIDPAGGINTCLTDTGEIASRDRWSWSQFRALWVFSKLCNRFGSRPEWRSAAEGIYDFVTQAGLPDSGHWPLLLDGDGRILRGHESIYADGFAIYGFTEWFRLTGDPQARDLALATFAATEEALNAETPPPAWPYPIPDGQTAHGLSMLFSLVYHELAQATGDRRVQDAALRHHRRVMALFYRPDRDLILEALDTAGAELAPPEGTVVLPGHAIESLWMQMHLARDRDDEGTQREAARLILRHLELGWDEEYGGIRLAVDADGRPEPAWPFHDTKLWWPQTEALYATLLAYELTREDAFLEWHERIRGYCLAHYPVPGCREWTQKLDRQGRPFTAVVALPVKDPFHLPRALIYCIDVLERLVQS